MSVITCLNQSEFDQLVSECEIIHRTTEIKVMQHKTTQHYVKLFRRQNILSTDFFYPYAKRFIHAADKLTALGIKTVKVVSLRYFKPEKRYIVTYEGIPGDSIRDLLQQQNVHDDKIKQLADYFHTLHEKGIFFRALHFGNIIEVEPNQYGLVDIANVLFYKNPLSYYQRLRNLKHLVRAISRDKYDSQHLTQTQFNQLIHAYLQQQNFSQKRTQYLIKTLNKVAQSSKRSDKFFQIVPLEKV